MSRFKYIILGGGNSSGYAAKEFLKRGISKGELCILTEEQVRKASPRNRACFGLI